MVEVSSGFMQYLTENIMCKNDVIILRLPVKFKTSETKVYWKLFSRFFITTLLWFTEI